MYIGLDLGTSGLKGIVIDDDQSILAEATAPLEVNRPFDGWSEQAPASWLDATDAVMRALHGQWDRMLGDNTLCIVDQHRLQRRSPQIEADEHLRLPDARASCPE